MECRKCKKDIPDGSAYCCHCGVRQDPQRSGHSRPNGMGTAYRRGKTWTGKAAGYVYAEINEDGERVLVRRRPTKGGFATKTDALKWAASYTAARDTESVTLQQMWEGWSANDMLRLSYDKQLAYRKARQRLEGVIGRKIATLTIDDLQAVVNAAPSHYTARDIKSLLSHLYKRAMAANGGHSAVTVNLSKFIVLPELEEQSPEPFSEDELTRIWAAWQGGDTYAGYALLMIYTSMMPGELQALTKAMIDWDKREIYGAGRKTKERKETPIVLPDYILPVLKELCARSPGDKVMPHCEEAFYRNYYLMLEGARVRRLPPYSCRHTTATAAVKMGVALPVVKEIMRHAKLSSTQRYVHVSSEAAHAAVNQLKKM